MQLGALHQVGRARSTGESDDKVWLAFVNHALIANDPGGAAVLGPIGVKLSIGDEPVARPGLRQAVGAGGGAVDQQSDWLFGG